jgi:hypothetical protein
MRWYNWLLVSCLPVGIAIFAAALWFGSSGTGEYRDSPNGKFVAHASNLSRGTWFNGRVQYIELLVVAAATDRELWRAEFRPEAGVKVPDYGDRSQPRSIDWATDSSAVTIPIGVDRKVTFPVH